MAINHNNKGFSLVELSIVLVILGLLTGGILTGQNLIRAAELRSVVTELQAYQTAVNTFKDKYFALPGDMSNAEDFWGTMATGTCPNATAGTGTQTCNGDGDGTIDTAAAASQTGERFTFWQHLANAGLIEGTYTGIAGAADSEQSVIGENVPRSKISNAGWTARNVGIISGDTNMFDGDYGNEFIYGAESPTGATQIRVLTPEETWNIDTKLDDGMPGRGKLIARFYDTCTDAGASPGGSAVLDAAYLLTDNSTQCAIHFPKALK